MSLQRADVTGIDALFKHLKGYEFCRVEVKRGTNTVFVRYGENNDDTQELKDELKEWAESLLESDPQNATLYKISLSGKNNPEAKGSGHKFLTFDFRLNDTSAITSLSKSSNVGGDVYLELGELRAVNQQLTEENERLMERVEELEALIDDQEQSTGNESEDMMGKLGQLLLPHIAPVLGPMIGEFGKSIMSKMMPGSQQPITHLAGVHDMNELIETLKKHDPQLEEHLAKLVAMAETNPQQFQWLLSMLGT